MEFYYINHNGKKVDLSTYPYLFQSGDILDWSYSYDSTEGIRNDVSNFRKGIKEFSVQIAVMCDFSIPIDERREEWKTSVNTLLEILEEDILDEKEGKLYTDTGFYMNCMIISSAKSNWRMGFPFMFDTFKVLAKNPVWIKENLYHFDIGRNVESKGKRYAYGYGYMYGGQINNTSMINPHFYDTDFLLSIYGPVLNPVVYIGNIPYLVYSDIKKGERLEINSITGTVEKIRANGQSDDQFHFRQKEPSVFTKIKPGRQPVKWSGNFAFDITLYERRSAAKW